MDCQWACPAHTDVPEYIRLIAQGRYTDAYLLNRRVECVSRAFSGASATGPASRPAGAAASRTNRWRSAASSASPRISRASSTACCRRRRRASNGKRIACIGAGPASLTVANDLAPLGYEVTIFEQNSVPGGLMRSNIPSFRLPQTVLDEEIGMILDMGVDAASSARRSTACEQLLEDGGYDAVFVGSGAPKGKELELPGRHETDRIHIGITWLESVAFGHIGSIGERVLIIGVGNTAMDCCRTSLRLGAKSVKVMARKPRGFFKASDLGARGCRGRERRDHRQSFAQVVRDRERAAHRHAVRADGIRAATTASSRASAWSARCMIPCDDVILAIGQENAFTWIERDIGMKFDKWDQPVVDPVTFQSTLPQVFFGGDAAQGPKNIIWAVEHGAPGRAVDPQLLQRRGGRPSGRAPGVTLSSRKMGMHEWSYKNDYAPLERRLMPHVSLKERFKKLNIEVELGFTAEQAAQEAQRCLNCDIQTVFEAKLCIECDACIDICPVDCLTITHDGEEADLRARLRAPALEPTQPLYVSARAAADRRA